MIKSFDDVLSGDIILTRNGTWLSKTIRWVTKLQTGKADYSHAAVGLGRGLVIEALWKITIGDIKKYAGQEIQIWRLPLTDEQRRKFEFGMMQTAGGAYGLTKLPLFALDAFATQFSKLWKAKKPCFWFTSTFGITNIPVCSQLVVWGIQKFAGFDFLDEARLDVNWKSVSPDYLQDLLNLPANKAELIFQHP